MPTSSFATDDIQLELKQPLGHGGQTSLSYKVRIRGKEYFMKQLRPEQKSDHRYRALFQKEFEVGSAVDHSHVVRYLQMGEDADGVFILMEYVNGQTLEQKLALEPEYFRQGGNFEKVFRQLLEGIGVLHRANVAYMDISPENVMLTQVSGDVKIVDLGFCLADSYSHTVGCSMKFAAPELRQRNLGAVDSRTDIYAIGQLMNYIKDEAKVALPSRLQHIIDKCRQEGKLHRYNNVDEALAELDHKRTTQWKVWSVILSALLIISVMWGGGVDL